MEQEDRPTASAQNVEPLAATRRTSGDIYDYLRERILQGEIAPHTVISQVKLADQLGVSRTPLREAMRRLQQEELIVAEPNRRARVAGFNAAELEAVYTRRLFYEPLGILLSVPRSDDRQIEALLGMVAEMRAAKEEDDYPRWEVAHKGFHRALVANAGSLLPSILTSIERGEPYGRFARSQNGRAWSYWDADHERIVDACQERDETAASVELARHLARTALALIATFQPDYDPVQIRAALALVTREPG